MSQPEPGVSDEPATEREEILSLLASQIRNIHDRIEGYDIEGPEDEQLLIRWNRTLGQLAGQYRKLKKDTDVDEMEDELELIKEAVEVADQRW